MELSYLIDSTGSIIIIIKKRKQKKKTNYYYYYIFILFIFNGFISFSSLSRIV